MAAERYRCETILGYLVEKGADINIQDNKGVTIFQIDYTTESRLVLLIQFDSVSFSGSCEHSLFHSAL